MSTDFNSKGRQVTFMAVKDVPPYFSILGHDVLVFTENIEKEIAACNQDTQDTHKATLAEPALGCFERFRGCVLQISRIVQHEEQIRAKAPQSVGKMVALRGAEVLVDFESLLFHSRSALDRVAFFVAKQIYNQECDKYPRLLNVLQNFEKRDRRAADLINITNTVNPFFEGILFDDPSGKKSLRSHLIHKSTASENSKALFTLHCVSPQKQIAFDAILGNYPLFKTAHSLGQGLTFFILNALSLYVGSGHTLQLSSCALVWHSRMVDFRVYETMSGDANRFTIWNITPSGCSLRPVQLSPEVMDEAY